MEGLKNIPKSSLILWGLLILLFLTILTLFLPKPWLQGEKQLYTSYRVEEVQEILLGHQDIKLYLSSQGWMVEDEQGDSWPGNEQAVQELLALPASLTYHPLSLDGQAPEFSQWENGLSVKYLDNRGETMVELLIPPGNGAYPFLFGDEKGLIHLSNQRTPALTMVDYFNLSPWDDLNPRELNYISLHTPLEGEAAQYFNYTLNRNESQWSIEPGGWDIHEDIMVELVEDIRSLRAVSMLNIDRMVPQGLRFSLELRDSSNEKWVLNVFDPLLLQEMMLWPSALEGTPYVYLFTREDLALIARSAQSLQ